MRIVSLLPSATEIVCALGLADSLVGVTHECDYPPAVRALPKVTRTLIPIDASSAEIDRLVRERLASGSALYTLDLPVLERLGPDLIVTQALCDVCAVAEAEVQDAACRLPGAPRVLNLEPTTLDEVFAAMIAVGEATGTGATARDVVARLRARVEAAARRAAAIADPRPRVAMLEWVDPPFSAGHWNPELVRLAGGVDVLGREGERSRTLQWDEVVAAQPEVVVIACCGFDVDRTLQELRASAETLAGPWASLPAVRNGRVYVLDGSAYFSRPGPRLVDSLELLARAIAPGIHPLPAGLPEPVAVEWIARDRRDGEPPAAHGHREADAR